MIFHSVLSGVKNNQSLNAILHSHYQYLYQFLGMTHE